MAAAIEFQQVSRRFGSVKAVDEVSLAIAPGEFFALLGPSGSGKTTCLRLIAGFEQPSSGHVLLDGADVTGVPPYERNVNTVFQDYALFPHMSVVDNVAYGLRVRGVAGDERRKRAEEMLALVQLEGLGERSPLQLSGGQKQRVALARALINRPAVLLLDEPLGALDLKLREAMQIELKNLQRKLKITFVYRDARPGRSTQHGGPGRRVRSRSHRAARYATRSVHAAAHGFRRAFRRRRERR